MVKKSIQILIALLVVGVFLLWKGGLLFQIIGFPHVFSKFAGHGGGDYPVYLPFKLDCPSTYEKDGKFYEIKYCKVFIDGVRTYDNQRFFGTLKWTLEPSVSYQVVMSKRWSTSQAYGCPVSGISKGWICWPSYNFGAITVDAHSTLYFDWTVNGFGAEISKGEFCKLNPGVELCAPLPVPPKPKPFFEIIIDKIKSWIKSLFDWFIKYQIVGEKEPLVGSLQTYTISVSATKPDSDFSDGSYQLQQANWALIDKAGAIKQQGEWEEVDGTYTKTVTITIPTEPARYVLIATIYQYDMVYDTTTKAWKITKEEVVAKEAYDIRSVPPAPPIKPPPSFGEIIKKIVDWLKSLFGWLFK